MQSGQSQEGRPLFSRARDIYRRRPVAAWAGAVVLVGVVLAVIVILVVGGDGSEPLDARIKCSVYDSRENVRIEFDGRTTRRGKEEGCASQAQEWSSARTGYWKSGTPALPEEEPVVVCSLHSVAGEPEFAGIVFVEARTESGENFGTRLCAELAHKGWSQAVAPTGGPWVHEWRQAELERMQADEAERELAEAEDTEREEREQALYACEEDARVREESEDEAIESETQERLKMSSGGAEVELEIEEEGWAQEEAAEGRREAAVERCEHAVEGEPGVASPEGGTEYR